MAQVDAFKNNATDYPVYGLPWTVVVPILDADGDPVTSGTISSTVSTNGDTAGAGATPVQIATSQGAFYLSLTAAEMTGNIIMGSVSSDATGAKKTLFTLYPRVLPILLTSDNAGAYDSTTTINLGSSASAIDDFYNGCIVSIYGGTGENQVRRILDYSGSTKIATVHVAWATNPDATSDLKIYRTDLAPYVMGADITHIAGTAQTARDIGASVILANATHTGAVIPTVTTVTNAPTGMALEATLGNATYGLNALHTDIAAIPTTSSSGVQLTDVVEGALTLQHVLRIMLAALANKSTGGGTTAPKFRDVSDAKNRISATVDSSGNRTTVTLDGT